MRDATIVCRRVIVGMVRMGWSGGLMEHPEAQESAHTAFDSTGTWLKTSE